MALAFFPRGGSAHVARNLAVALRAAGWDVTVVIGLAARGRGDRATRRAFYAGLDVRPVDMTAALSARRPDGGAEPPLHPSYEDRPDAPDRVFAALDDDAYERQVDGVVRARCSRAGAANADVLHLHHLTPLHEAAARVAPGVPVVGHLHGTELLMLEAIEAGAGRWPYAEAGRSGCATGPQRCERVIVLSETQVARARGAARASIADRCVRVANGFDPEAFDAAPGRPPRPLAPPPGRRAARLGARRRRRLACATTRRSRGVRRRQGTRRCCSTSAASPRSSASPLLIEAYAARPRRLRPPRAARARRRLPGRVGGRAPDRHGPPPRRARRLPGRLARPRRAARVPRRLRRRRAPVGARAVRPGARRGRWPAACPAIAVDAYGPADDRRPRRDRLARRARRPHRRSRTRSCKRSTPAGAARGAATRPAAPRASATRGRRWRTRSRASTPRRGAAPSPAASEPRAVRTPRSGGGGATPVRTGVICNNIASKVPNDPVIAASRARRSRLPGDPGRGRCYLPRSRRSPTARSTGVTRMPGKPRPTGPVGLYDPTYEHDACGVAFVARLDGAPSHETVQRAIVALENLEHRGAAGRRPEHGRRRRDPHADARRVPARAGRAGPAAAGPLRRRRLLPAAGRGRAAPSSRRCSRRPSTPRASASSAGATCRSTRTTSASPPTSTRPTSSTWSSPPRATSPTTRTPSSASCT